jgi:hypothetical protein
VFIATIGVLLSSGQSVSSADQNGSSAGVNDGRPRAVEQTVNDDVKDVTQAASSVGDLGDRAKRFAEFRVTEMQLTRFNLPLTPGQEFILLDRVRKVGQFAEQLERIRTSAGQRQQRIAELGALLEKRIEEVNGPAKEVRLKFARVETLGSQWGWTYTSPAEGGVFGVDAAGTYRNLVGKMARGQDLTAADVARLVHTAERLAVAARETAEFEREFNELLVVTVGRTEVAGYYGQSDDVTPEACLAERLNACSACVVGLYARAKDAFDFFLGGTPDLPYRFEFPELSPDEMKRANALLAELAARRATK